MDRGLLLQHIQKARNLIPDSSAYLTREDVKSADEAQFELLSAQALILAEDEKLCRDLEEEVEIPITEPLFGEKEEGRENLQDQILQAAAESCYVSSRDTYLTLTKDTP
jgi:hypothetical protein